VATSVGFTEFVVRSGAKIGVGRGVDTPGIEPVDGELVAMDTAPDGEGRALSVGAILDPTTPRTATATIADTTGSATK
jgi:hypothetical protein